jgi:transposase
MLFVGDDWAEDHHDVEIVDDTGRVLARRRLPEGPGGITRLHALIGEHMPEGWADWEPARAAAMVKVGIETDRGPWVAALVATGYEVFAINPMSVARYRERHSTSGAKSDSADAHVLAEIVRLDRAHHRPLAGDSDQGEAIKLTARTHQSLVWDRTRHVLPAILQGFRSSDLDRRREPEGRQARCGRCCRPYSMIRSAMPVLSMRRQPQPCRTRPWRSSARSGRRTRRVPPARRQVSCAAAPRSPC